MKVKSIEIIDTDAIFAIGDDYYYADSSPVEGEYIGKIKEIILSIEPRSTALIIKLVCEKGEAKIFTNATYWAEE